jgi:threonine aldolase
MEYIDFRSDTVTQPTEVMRLAMAQAKVGDDVYGEDPTVNELQAKAAGLMGKEAGLFVASGTMGNLIAMLAHCDRGAEVIVGNKAHVFLHEAGGISVLGGVHSCQLPNQADGSINLEDITAAIRSDDEHEPITRLICLENTHNACGGTCQTPAYVRAVSELGHASGLKVHLDGARIFNAAAALGVPAKEITGSVDSITFCLSKGLCAPVGSVLCGTKEFIKIAHRIRKLLGGGMRQAGILAAAGIVALDSMVERLSEDHQRARRLAETIEDIPGIYFDLGKPATNMVFIFIGDEIPFDAEALADMLKDRGVLVGTTGLRSMRLVTHYWIDDKGIDIAAQAFHDVFCGK